MVVTNTFPALYSLASTNKIKIWKIRVESNIILTEYGYIDGKMTEAKKIIAKGKNIGKANATTPNEQAVSEARSKWNKKLKQNSTTNLESLKHSKKDYHSRTAVLLPMLALNFKTRSHDIVYPCVVQPKLDGARCVYNNGVLTSRTGKVFTSMDHITDELEDAGILDILDGELYSDNLNFQDIIGMIKKETITSPKELKKALLVEYTVYDIISDDAYSTRSAILKEIFRTHKFKYIKLIRSDIANSVEDIKKYHDVYVKLGYEGAIVRNLSGMYKLKHRSKDLQKYKEFEDSEFKIVDFTEGEGAETGCVIWICETKKGLRFSVRPKGTREERKILYKNGKDYINKKLNVVYQGLTNDGIPRFGVATPGVYIRDPNI